MSDKESDVCVICGDNASGFHFNAFTCESCKAFFRRNALKNKEHRCFLGGNCKIDVTNRKSCKKCRLKKCFDIGMKTDYILTDEQKQLRKAIIAENRKRKRQGSNDIQESDGSVSPPQVKSLKDTNSLFDFLETDSFDSKEINEEIIEIENYISNHNNYQNMTDISYNVNQMAAELESSVNTIAKPIAVYNKGFNDMEINRLSELLSATHILESPLASNTSLTNKFCEAVRVMHLKCNQEITKVVKMAKKLSAFESICESDQLVLIKYSAIEINNLQLIKYFDFEWQYWTINLDNNSSILVKLDLLKGGKRNTYVNHKNFLQNMESEWDSDNNIIDLLTAVILFNPNRPNLISRNLIEFQQHIYMHLLQRYLILKYRSDFESKSKFSKLLNNLNELNILDEKIAQAYSESKRVLTLPLMKEICDRNI